MGELVKGHLMSLELVKGHLMNSELANACQSSMRTPSARECPTSLGWGSGMVRTLLSNSCPSTLTEALLELVINLECLHGSVLMFILYLASSSYNSILK